MHRAIASCTSPLAPWRAANVRIAWRAAGADCATAGSDHRLEPRAMSAELDFQVICTLLSGYPFASVPTGPDLSRTLAGRGCSGASAPVRGGAPRDDRTQVGQITVSSPPLITEIP